MIKKELIYHKRVIHHGSYGPYGNKKSDYTGMNKKVNSQEELEAYIMKNDVIIGSFVVYKASIENLLGRASKEGYTPDLNTVITVLDVEYKYENLKPGTDRGWPKCYKLVTCGQVINPYIRWDSMNDYVLLTPEQEELILKSQYDLIASNIQEAIKNDRSR